MEFDFWLLEQNNVCATRTLMALERTIRFFLSNFAAVKARNINANATIPTAE
ncbi:MAG: hypothetical protein LBL74_07965 [Bacteroidales bacterium]|nr:hypothetical protein [Bacteroidales bacterium]